MTKTAKHLLAPAAVAVAIVVGGDAMASDDCEYSDIARNISLSEPSSLTQTTINGHFGYVVKFKSGPKVSVEYVDNSGPDHLWTINGKPGWGYEISRRRLHGATLDLNQSIDWTE